MFGHRRQFYIVSIAILQDGKMYAFQNKSPSDQSKCNTCFFAFICSICDIDGDSSELAHIIELVLNFG